MLNRWKPAPAIGLFVGLSLAGTQGGRAAGPADEGQSQLPAADQSVPANLRPLLAAPQSEMRLVTQRYTADRVTLSGNYQGGVEGGRGGGRGGPAAAAGAGGQASPAAGPAAERPPSLSPNRIARLKQFDLEWQSALGRIDPATLSATARTDLDALQGTIAGNLAQLEADTAAIAEISPLVPFAPRIVALYESRVRMEDMNPQQAAGEVTAITREIAAVRARLEDGLSDAAGGDAVRADRDLAMRGAVAVDSLHASLTNWFNFFNGYDPLFTWWMGLPYKHADTGLKDYAAFLRERVAPANRASSPAPKATPVLPRRNHAPGRDADRAASPRADETDAHAGHAARLEVLRRDLRAVAGSLPQHSRSACRPAMRPTPDPRRVTSARSARRKTGLSIFVCFLVFVPVRRAA